MSIDKKDKKEEQPMNFNNHLNREERYRTTSPIHGPIKSEFSNIRDLSPERAKELKDMPHRDNHSINYKDQPKYYEKYPPFPHPTMDPSNNPYRLPSRQFYQRRYNEFPSLKKKEDLNLNDAMQFLETVKSAYANDLSVYDSFLEVMGDYKHGKLDAGGVVRAATSLFKSKPELLEGFNGFLPGEYRIDRQRRRVNLDPRNPRMGNNDRHIDRQLEERHHERNGDRVPNRHHERNYERNPDVRNPDLRSSDLRSHERNPDLRSSDLRNPDVRNSDLRNPDVRNMERTHERNMERSHERTHERSHERNMERIKEPLDRMMQPISDRLPNEKGDQNKFYPNQNIPNSIHLSNNHINSSSHISNVNPNTNNSINNTINMWENPQTNEQLLALNFIKKAKIRLKATNTYKQFIDLLTTFQKTNDKNLIAKFHKILGDFPELLEEFLTFVPKKEDAVITEIKKVLEEKGVYEEFLKAMNLFNQKLMDGKDLLFLLSAYIKDDQMIESFKIHLGEPDLKKENKDFKKESFMINSYRICSKIPLTNQEPIAKQVLNNICYSFPLYASEGGETVKKSAYMDTIFRLEDERYELELHIQRAENLAETFEIFLNKQLEDDDSEEELDLFSLEMPPCLINEIITNIYGDEGDEIFDELINKPKVAMPIILKRIYKLIKIWKIEMREKQNIWRESLDRTFYKSLDFHLDFKSTDKKFLTYRNFLKNLECSINISDLKSCIELAKKLVFIRYEDNISDLISEGTKILQANDTARIRYFFILTKRISEMKDFPFFNDLIILLEKQIENPSIEFEEDLRILGKTKAYKLCTFERLIERIHKKESENNETFNVTIDDYLTIKNISEYEENQEEILNENIDYSLIQSLPYKKINLKNESEYFLNYKIKVKENNNKIRYSEDEIDFVFKKGFLRNVYKMDKNS